MIPEKLGTASSLWVCLLKRRRTWNASSSSDSSSSAKVISNQINNQGITKKNIEEVNPNRYFENNRKRKRLYWKMWVLEEQRNLGGNDSDCRLSLKAFEHCSSCVCPP